MGLFVRYAAYLAFAVAAMAFWLWAMPLSFGEPACIGERGGCPEPSTAMRFVNFMKVYGAIPLTVLLFVFYRRGVRHFLGHCQSGFRE